jgi:hypothetical protein
MRWNERVIAGLCLGAVACLGTAPPAHAGGPGGAQFFLDPIQFEQTMADIGKFSKAQWDFKPDNVPAESINAIDDILDITTHPVNAPGVWEDAAGNDLWPPEVDNVRFSSNLTPGPGQPLTPHGVTGLVYLKPPVFELDSNVLAANFFVDSFDIISGPPAGDNHTAISFEMVQVAVGGAPPPVFLVSVFNKNEELIGTFAIDGAPNQRIFLGILAPPGDTIQRVDIWDQSGGAEGISFLALYQQQGQLPACPGDCAFPPDKVVNVVDFLALIAQWGGPGSCDLDGNGTVNVLDFLDLIAIWGPCPAPGNDECVDKTFIELLDPAGQQDVSFDMYGATPSPEPSRCLGIDVIPFKDSWYCLRNNTGTPTTVTISGSVDLLVEVTAGCVCPPGPLVACGRTVAGDTVFPLQPGEEVCIRLINDLDLPNDELKGNLTIFNEPGIICINDCGTGNVFESEVCGTDTNGGCNSDPPVFGAAQCGDTICGNAWADLGTRETDWYFVDLPDPDGDGVEELRATLTSEFNGVCFIVDGVGPDGVPCAPLIVGTTGSAINCDPTGDAFACLPAPGTYVVFVAPAEFTGAPCAAGNNDYTVAITCNPCPPGAMPRTAFDADTSARLLAPASP